MHQEQKNQGVEAGGINPNAKTGETTVTLTPVQRDAAHLAEVPYAAIRARDYSMGDKPASFIPRNAHACNVCEDGYKAIHNGICTNAACPFSVVGGNR